MLRLKKKDNKTIESSKKTIQFLIFGRQNKLRSLFEFSGSVRITKGLFEAQKALFENIACVEQSAMLFMINFAE